MRDKRNFKEILMIVKELSVSNRILFFDKISSNVPIAIRMVLLREELKSEEKLKAIKWLNEFLSEINSIKRTSELILASNTEINTLAKYVKYIGMESDGLLASEIVFCIEDAYQNLRRNSFKDDHPPALS